MAGRPADFVCGEADTSKRYVHRHIALRPARAVIVGINDDAMLAYGDQPVGRCACNGDKQCSGWVLDRDRRCIQGLDTCESGSFARQGNAHDE